MTHLPDIEQAAHRSNRRRVLLGVILLLLLLAALLTLPLDEWLLQTRSWIERNTALGAVLFVIAFVVLTVAMVPGSLLMACGGFLFGLTLGLPIVWLGIGPGAGLSALISRTLARDWLAGRFKRDARFVAINDAVADKGLLIVTLSRLSLLMPFNLLNVIYGLSRIPLGKLIIGTWFGMTPAVVLYTYLGSAAADVEQLMARDLSNGLVGRLVVIGGLVMIAVVTFVVHRTATRALQRELRDTE